MDASICSLSEWVRRCRSHIHKLEILHELNHMVVHTSVGVLIPPLSKFLIQPLAQIVDWEYPIQTQEDFTTLLSVAREIVDAAETAGHF